MPSEYQWTVSIPRERDEAMAKKKSVTIYSRKIDGDPSNRGQAVRFSKDRTTVLGLVSLIQYRPEHGTSDVVVLSVRQLALFLRFLGARAIRSAMKDGGRA